MCLFCSRPLRLPLAALSGEHQQRNLAEGKQFAFPVACKVQIVFILLSAEPTGLSLTQKVPFFSQWSYHEAPRAAEAVGSQDRPASGTWGLCRSSAAAPAVPPRGHSTPPPPHVAGHGYRHDLSSECSLFLHFYLFHHFHAEGSRVEISLRFLTARVTQATTAGREPRHFADGVLSSPSSECTAVCS